MKHDIDFLTDWCKNCGQSRKDIVETGFECQATENVVAISHRVRGQVLKHLAEC